jgi:hypothetical protein
LFSSMPHPDGVNIPKIWSDFFTVNLLNPSRFAWAKSFLESAAWNLIVQDREGETCFTFSIPKDYPSMKPLRCSEIDVSNQVHQEEIASTRKQIVNVTDQDQQRGNATPTKQIASQADVSSSSMHPKRKFAKAPLVSTEVRRNKRIKENHKGFKDSQCKGKSCICCNVEAPTLSNKVMRCLGKELCKIPSKALTDEELIKKPHSKKLAGPRVKQNKEK